MIRKLELWGVNLSLSALILVVAIATAYAGIESMVPFSVDSQDMLISLIFVSVLKESVVSGVMAYLP